ncbi:ferritin-like domain-containing protein [Actinospongicola halichondriae]|uniref:ferritin-like domain-containing protein n=1 Tax=Actinospongicola halichondriae TaxID=3236844 RepID=UPI003D39E6DE
METPNNDFSRDEFNRQMREVEAQNKAAMPKWRETLDRVFNGGVDMTTAEKAHLLGVPGRRQFFKIGGATIAGAALLAACGDDDDTASAPTSGDGGGSNEGDDPNMDIVLANTAISLEILAIDTYQVAIDSGLVTTQAVADAAGLFQQHHQEHADALKGVVGSGAYDQANAAVKTALVDPAVEAASAEGDIIKLAFDLETAAAQTYVFAAGALSTPELRSTIMTIGGVESRHATILGQVAMYDAATVFPSFYKSDNPLPEGAVITE